MIIEHTKAGKRPLCFRLSHCDRHRNSKKDEINVQTRMRKVENKGF